MKTEINQGIYLNYLDKISKIYEHARITLVQSYWDIGEMIVEVEQKQSSKAPYGKNIIERLSADLIKKYGSGFSITNLKDMRRFYMVNSIGRPVAQLEWSKHLVLLTVKDDKIRRKFEKRAIEENLTRDQLKRIVKDYNKSMRSEGNSKDVQLALSRGTLYTYSFVDLKKLPALGSEIIVDCGFNVWRSIPTEKAGDFDSRRIVRSIKKNGRYHLEDAGNDENMLYTYRCFIEKVIDGDTVWAVIDLGFETIIRQKLRLRGIDAPENNTQEGRKAKRYLEMIFKENTDIVIKTHKSDKYDRYLSDIFYILDEDDPQRIAEEGIFLNQELLDKGLARVF